MRVWPRGGLWRHADFLKLWSAETVSQVGTQVSGLALPLVAMPVQRGITRWLAGNSQALGRLSGALLIAIAAFGIWVDLLPNLRG